MKDRIANDPGRYKLEFEGELGTQHAILSLDDNPVEEGTVINSTNMLGEEALTALGLDINAVPTDAFVNLNNRQDVLETDMSMQSASTFAQIQELNTDIQEINNIIDSEPLILYGTSSVQLTGGTWSDFTVTFKTAFKENTQPIVVFTPLHNSGVSYIYYKLLSKTNRQFTGRINSSGSGTHQINWIAIGIKP